MRAVAHTESKLRPDIQVALSGVRHALETGGAGASLLVRILRVMTTKVEQAPRSVVASAVAQDSDAAALLAFLKATPLELGQDHDPLLQARIKGMERMGALLRHGGLAPLTSEQVVDLLKVSRQSIHTWRHERRILGLPQARRGFLYPAWQFDLDRHRVVDGIAEVLAVIDPTDPWSLVIFFASPNIVVDGQAPIDVLKNRPNDASRARVMRAAALWQQHGAS